MTDFSRTPRASSKVDEAEFFLLHMRDVHPPAGAHADPGQAFRYYLNWNDAGAQKLRAELTERLARAMLASADESPYPTALA